MLVTAMDEVKWVQRRSYCLKTVRILRIRLHFCASVTTPQERMADNSVLNGELRAARCSGFQRLVLQALPHLRLQHPFRRTV